MVDFTIAIPTYNGASRIPEVLECLRQTEQALSSGDLQLGNEQFSWEILIVDNNSTDNTAQVIQAYRANWHQQSCPLRYCFEAEQGAAFARQRAIREAKGELVGFLDDDTLPNLDWVTQAYAFAQEHPQAGAFGSQIHGQFEVEPPENFQRIKVFLAIVERGQHAHRYELRKKMLPPSAGLVVRKQAWLQSVPARLFLSGRTPDSMLTSEDTEAIAYIQAAGWEIWYNPRMEIYHKIPRKRLEKDYLVSMVRGIGLARHHIRMVRTKGWLRPFIIPAFVANDIRRIVIHLIKHRLAIRTDLAAACEMEFLWSSLLSPFYLLSRRLFNSRASLAMPVQSAVKD